MLLQKKLNNTDIAYKVKKKKSPPQLLQCTKKLDITFKLLKNLASETVINVYFFFTLSHKGFKVAINTIHTYSFKSHLGG